MPSIDISANDARVQYTASAAQTVFNYDFVVFDEEDIVVIQDGATLTLTTDYTVTGVENESGGTIVLTSGATLNDLVTIYRNTAPQRTSQYQSDGIFDAAPIERDLDTIITILQEHDRDIARAVTLDDESSLTSISLPTPSANAVIAWNAGATALENGPSTSDLTTATSTATTAAATATTQAGIATTGAATATTQAGVATNQAAYAEEWAQSPEDDPVSVAAGGDNSTTFSALHWAAKAAASAGSADVGDIIALTEAAIATGDYIPFADVSDTNTVKRDTILDAVAATLLDEDNMASDSASRAPTQQSVKAYVDNNAPASGWTPIKTVTASAVATVDFINGTGGVVLDSTYNAYAIVMTDIVPSVDTEVLWIRTSTNAGSSFDSGASDYQWTATKYENATAASRGGSSGDTKIQLSQGTGIGNAAGEGLSGVIYLYKPSGTRYCRFTFDLGLVDGSTSGVQMPGAGFRKSSADVDAIRFLMSSGNITSGIFTLYGLASAP